ncbi:MAG: hypothetical protein K5694_01350 [Bacilli bacterium]|nr:hypothetical protein [Bacilli bacterium]
MGKLNNKILALAVLAVSLSGCTSNASLKGFFEASDAPSGAIDNRNGHPILSNNGYYLSFEKNSADLYGISIRDTANDSLLAYNNEPARLVIRGTESFGMYETHEYAKGYNEVTKTNYGYHCISIVETTAKSQFRLMDSYYLSQNHGFSLNRKVTVIKAKSRDKGFESIFTLKNGGESTDVENFEYFIPSTIYKDTQYNDSSALVTSIYNPQIYVKETRMGLPMTMIRNKTDSSYVSLVHAEPKITVNGELGGGYDGAVNDDLEYGSLGFESENSGEDIPLAVSFCYPCAEGPAIFDSEAGWSKKFHEVSDKHYHEYKLGLFVGKTNDFNDALVDSYEKASPYVASSCDQVSNEKVYQQNIDCFNKEYFGPSQAVDGNDSPCGLPWELNLDPDKARGAYSLQMGFVGQQTSIGAHLYREGLLKNNQEYIYKGKNIVDFWTSKKIYPDGQIFPYIWWEGNDVSHASGKSPYAAIYLRMLCDGVEGILDAYQYGLENGVDNDEWLEYCIRVADQLIASQNDDGSFNRAFTADGGIPGDTFKDKNIGYDSSDPAKFKINTPVAIRFLTKMYNLTNNENYKTSAIEAADYSYENIYLKLGKYVGGTCDNANVVDKEAAIYAMFGFRSAYSLTQDARYEKAMRHAACCSLSWTFMYDFACPAGENDEEFCPYVDGHTMGASIIATGHAGADCFSCYIWYDIFKLYELTGLEIYKDIAITLQNACKYLSDFQETRNWRYPCLMAEACQVSDFLYHPTGKNGTVWLPWCGVAQVNPIIYTFQDYGVYQLEEVVLK